MKKTGNVIELLQLKILTKECQKQDKTIWAVILVDAFVMSILNGTRATGD